VALGAAGLLLTVITLASSVILPAQMNRPSHASRDLVASHATPPASNDLVTLASVTVVAAREPGAVAIAPLSSAAR
jgi:hypothetical protein